MEQHSIGDSSVDWRALLEHVVRDSVSIEVKQGEETVACISPMRNKLPICDLNAVFASFPSLGNDVASFAKDLNAISNSVPVETNPWD